METTRTIEQVLAIRLRAAQLRVLERTTALIKEQEGVEQNWTGQRDEAGHAKLLDAKRLADEDVQLVQREIDTQQGLDVEPVRYDNSHFATRRYAAILMQDNPELDAATALDQARQDERTRFEDYYARNHDDSDLDELDEDADQ